MIVIRVDAAANCDNSLFLILPVAVDTLMGLLGLLSFEMLPTCTQDGDCKAHGSTEKLLPI